MSIIRRLKDVCLKWLIAYKFTQKCTINLTHKLRPIRKKTWQMEIYYIYILIYYIAEILQSSPHFFIDVVHCKKKSPVLTAFILCQPEKQWQHTQAPAHRFFPQPSTEGCCVIRDSGLRALKPGPFSNLLHAEGRPPDTRQRKGEEKAE